MIFIIFITILLDKNVWFNLKNSSPNARNFFTKENKDLLFNIKKIRNNISHPSLVVYTIKDYQLWESEIESAAQLFGTNLSELKVELHELERRKLLEMILSKVVNPALSNPNIKNKTKNSIENTKLRLEQQNNAQGIIFFFTDSLNSLRGKEIQKELHQNNLQAFEDIQEEVLNAYYE